MTRRLTRVAAALAATPLFLLTALVPAEAATAVAVRYGPTPPRGWPSSPATTSVTTLASSTEAAGVVLIETVVGYGSGEAAGTGLVLTSDGIVATNHHVVEGSTQVAVTDPATGASYLADVIGYEPETDVAVLQLQAAGGLATVDVDTAAVHQGDDVTVVGNSNGGGVLTATGGEITDTDAEITVSQEDGTTQDLTDLIEVAATVVPGDSGGALLDEDGEVIGMNVAASSSGFTGYAIEISTVIDLANQILTGDDSGAVALGYAPALGLQLSGETREPLVLGVVSGSAADNAGITAGSVLTELDGAQIDSYAQVTAALADYEPGDTVTVGWIDSYGIARVATTTLGRAPLA